MTGEDRPTTVGTVKSLYLLNIKKMEYIIFTQPKQSKVKAAIVFAKRTNRNSIQEVIPISLFNNDLLKTSSAPRTQQY